MESKRHEPNDNEIAFHKGENVWWTYGVTEETGGALKVLQGHVMHTYTHEDIREIPAIQIFCKHPTKGDTRKLNTNDVFTVPSEAVKRFT